MSGLSGEAEVPDSDGAAQEPSASGAVPRRSRPRGVSRPLLCILAVVGALFAYTTYANWVTVGYPGFEPIRARVADHVRQRDLARKAAMDPSQGDRGLPDVWSAAGLAAGPPMLATVVLFGGELSCCAAGVHETARRLDDIAAEATNRRARFVLAFRATPEEVKEFASEYRPSYPVVADGDGSLRDAYNAYWTPRAYVVADGTLRWIQKAGRVDFAAVRRSLAEVAVPGVQSARQISGKTGAAALPRPGGRSR